MLLDQLKFTVVEKVFKKCALFDDLGAGLMLLRMQVIKKCWNIFIDFINFNLNFKEEICSPTKYSVPNRYQSLKSPENAQIAAAP